MAMKPIDGTFVNNALTWGVAGLWIDGGRIETDWNDRPESWKQSGFNKNQNKSMFGIGGTGININKGRFPANLIHDGSDEVLELFPQTGKSSGGRIGNKGSALNMMGTKYEAGDPGYGDEGSAARFFYTAKASRAERNAGLEGMEERISNVSGIATDTHRCKVCGKWIDSSPSKQKREVRPKSSCWCDNPIPSNESTQNRLTQNLS